MVFEGLKTKEDFAAVVKKGRRFVLPGLSFYFLKKTQLNGPRISFRISKEAEKRAVRRNLIKRRLKSLVIKNKKDFLVFPGDFLVAASRQAGRQTFRDLAGSFEAFFKKLKSL